MSGREVDLDALFDRNADTQLLDRRRRDELGLVAQLAPASPTPARFGPESMLADEPPPRPRAAMLRVALDARPDRELIPGAVVTVVASVHDDGDAAAADVLLRIAVPAECEPLPDSFARDDVAFEGDALLGEGLRLGTVAAGQAVRVRFTMRVLPGTGPLDVIAHASAPGVPTIAAPALRLRRRAGHAAFDAPRPFFELEAGETDDSLAPVAAVTAPDPPRRVDALVDEPAAPEVVAPEVVAPQVVAPEVVVAARISAPAVPAPEISRAPEISPKTPAPKTSAHVPASDAVAPITRAPEVTAPAVVVVKRRSPKTPAPKAVEPEPKPAPAPKPAPKPRARKRAAKPAPELPRPYVLARALDDGEVRALERVFAGVVPHGLAAVALLSSIAAVDAPLGDALGVRAFTRTISAAVPRALVAARTNRPAPPIVTRESLETIRAFAPVPDDEFAQYFPLLVTRLDERELDGLRSVLARDLDDVFLRGVQVLLAVAPRALEGASPDPSARAGEALAAYRVAAGAWLMRVTVRRAVDRRYDPLVANDAALHEAGRVLVDALRAALA